MMSPRDSTRIQRTEPPKPAKSNLAIHPVPNRLRKSPPNSSKPPSAAERGEQGDHCIPSLEVERVSVIVEDHSHCVEVIGVASVFAHDVGSDRALYGSKVKDLTSVTAHHKAHEAAAETTDTVVEEQMSTRFHDSNATSTEPSNEAPLDA